MGIAVPEAQIGQATAPCDTRWHEAARYRRAERGRRRPADGDTGTDEADENGDWGRARTPEADALLLSRAVALGLDWLLYER